MTELSPSQGSVRLRMVVDYGVPVDPTAATGSGHRTAVKSLDISASEFGVGSEGADLHNQLTRCTEYADVRRIDVTSQALV